MKKLIKFNLRNIYHNKLFYVCTAISILSPIVSFILSLSSKTQNMKALPEIQSYLSTEIGLISMLFITLFCTFDFTEGTAKNVIARGYSKTKFLLSKYISTYIGLISMHGITIFVTFILSIKNGLGYESTMPIMLIFLIFKIFADTILYATIAFILEKNSSAIIANLFFSNIILLVLSIVDSKLHVNIGKYWFDNVGMKFLDNPIVANLSFPIIMYLIYIIAFSSIGIYFAKRKEIK